MANYKDFDINTSTTPKPWGAREEQMVKDLIDTVVLDSIGGVKRTTGHLHSKLYNEDDPSNWAMKCYTDILTRSIDIGRQKYGHNVSINCPGDAGQVFSVNNCNSYFNTPGIAMHTSTGGWCRTSIGNHYLGYPLIADYDLSIYTRKWSDITAAIAIEGFDSFETWSKVSSMELGSLVFMHLQIRGVSNQQYLRINVPWNLQVPDSSVNCVLGIVSGHDNSGEIGPIEASWDNGSHRIKFGEPGGEDTYWTNDGNKGVQGMLVFTISNPGHGWTLP